MEKTVQDKIEAAKVQAQEALAAQIKHIEHEDVLRNLAPDYAAPVRAGHTNYDNVNTLTYDAEGAEQVEQIINSYREKYGAFLPIGQYKKGCTVVTAYPWKEYLDEDTLVRIEDDAVEARNSKGEGFSSVEFYFYPKIEGYRIKVHINLAFRKYIQGFEGCIVPGNDHYGHRTVIRKDEPAAYKAAAYTLRYGGGTEDSADWRGVFNCDAFLESLNVRKEGTT